MTIQIVNISDIRPAEYNPRRIDDQQFKNLQKSLQEVGFVIPVLVNRSNNVIIAGHQRTKAAKAIGLTQVPAIMIDNVAYGDEIKFNQMHNGVDQQQGYSAVFKKQIELAPREFQTIDNRCFKVIKQGPAYVKEICRLILKYGNVFSCVVCNGQTLVGANYIKACQLLNIEVNAYVLPDDIFMKAKSYLEGKYGTYSYDEIERNTYVQGLAQMFRSVEGSEDKKGNHSQLYTNFVMPYLTLTPDAKSILDFGCGKGAYISYLAKRYDAVGVEFYNNNGKSINVTVGNRQIDKLIKHLREDSQFDVVVCDSVLNSVDSVQAENSVVTCLNLFCKDKLFISGRPYDEAVKKLDFTKDRATTKRYIEFLDENKFTAIYRKGNWYFQHYHSPEDVEKLLSSHGFHIDKIAWGKFGSSWQVEATKVNDLSPQQYIEAIDFEFDLPLPGGGSYGRNNDIKRILNLI